MKNDTMGIGTLIKNDELKELLKETIAIDEKQFSFNRSFGVVDMWNSQKKQRTSLEMRRRLN